MFNYCYSLKSIPKIDTTNGTNFQIMFQNCESIQIIPALNTTKGTNFSAIFYRNSNAQTIEQIDFKNASSIGTISVSKLEFVNFLNIGKSINISASNRLSRETIINGILNNLVDLTGQTSQTLTLGTTNLNKLTEEDKLIAVNRNWILA